MNGRNRTARADAVRVIVTMPAGYARDCIATVEDDRGNAGTQMRLDERGGRWCKSVHLRPGEAIRFRYGAAAETAHEAPHPDAARSVCDGVPSL